MKIIGTRLHGFLDYAVALFIIAMPWMFGFGVGGPETWVLIGSGLSTILYSMFTRYEYSLANVIPFSIHLALDAISGIFIACSPWLFGFHDLVFLPHLVIGSLEVAVVLLTKESTRLLNKKHRTTVRHNVR